MPTNPTSCNYKGAVLGLLTRLHAKLLVVQYEAEVIELCNQFAATVVAITAAQYAPKENL